MPNSFSNTHPAVWESSGDQMYNSVIKDDRKDHCKVRQMTYKAGYTTIIEVKIMFIKAK